MDAYEGPSQTNALLISSSLLNGEQVIQKDILYGYTDRKVQPIMSKVSQPLYNPNNSFSYSSHPLLQGRLKDIKQ